MQYTVKFNVSNKLSLHYFCEIQSLKSSEPVTLKHEFHAINTILASEEDKYDTS